MSAKVFKDSPNRGNPTSDNEAKVSGAAAASEANDVCSGNSTHTPNKVPKELNKDTIIGDGSHSHVKPRFEIYGKRMPKKVPVPRIIANNFKSTRSAEKETNGNVKESIPASVKTITLKSPEKDKIESPTHQNAKSKLRKGLRLKRSQELIDHQKARNPHLHPNSIVIGPHEVVPLIRHPSGSWLKSYQVGEKSSIVENVEKVWKENRYDNLRLIKPKNGVSPYFRRSLTVDKANKTVIKAPQKRPGGCTADYYLERRLLNYLSPRLNHPLSRTTYTTPISSKENTTGKSFMSCTIWIHLQVKNKPEIKN